MTPHPSAQENVLARSVAPHSTPLNSPLLHQRNPSVANTSTTSMATFPFDPTPFLPQGFSVVEVADRPTRARVVCRDFSAAN